MTQMSMVGGEARIVCDSCGKAVEKATLSIVPDLAASGNQKPYRYHADCVECFRAWSASTEASPEGVPLDSGAAPDTSTDLHPLSGQPVGDVIIDGVKYIRRDGKWIIAPAKGLQ